MWLKINQMYRHVKSRCTMKLPTCEDANVQTYIHMTHIHPVTHPRHAFPPVSLIPRPFCLSPVRCCKCLARF